MVFRDHLNVQRTRERQKGMCDEEKRGWGLEGEKMRKIIGEGRKNSCRAMMLHEWPG